MALNHEIRIEENGRTISRVVAGQNLRDAGELLAGEKKVFVVYDRNVAGWAEQLAGLCPGAATIPLGATERGKNMDSVLGICRSLLEAGADRSSLVVALGGGITSDMAGLAACLFKRGLRYANVPTTLLAQVDAGIGGKTGVNFLDFKNMLGVIRQPEWTFLCPSVLGTLPRRDFLSGAAELLKTFMIDNSSGSYAPSLGAIKGGDLPAKLIFDAAAVKAGIVGRDQFEGGERKKLNLGHTFAHAIEHEARESGMDITHGEAVAMGVILAARAAERMGIARSGLASRLEADFEGAGLPVSCPFAPARLAASMEKDKKADGGLVSFILPEGIGSVRIVPARVAEVAALLENNR